MLSLAAGILLLAVGAASLLVPGNDGSSFAFLNVNEGFTTTNWALEDANVFSDSNYVATPVDIETMKVGQRAVMGELPEGSHLSTWLPEHSPYLFTYPADSELPKGIDFEVTDGIVSAVTTEDKDSALLELVGSTYVPGDIDATDVTRLLWRSLHLSLRKPDGSMARVTVARPLWWIERTGARVGHTVELSVEEAGFGGSASILSIGPLDADWREGPDNAQLVISTIEYENAVVWELTFGDAGSLDTASPSDPLGVTAHHPIWSLDRDAWIAAGELNIGESVATLSGPQSLLRKTLRPGRHTVYNIEIHRSHAYHVAATGLLVHNTGIDNCGGSARKTIALGKDIPGAGYKELAAQKGGVRWEKWSEMNITQRQTAKHFGRAFHDAAKKADEIHFSLDGIPNASKAVELGRRGFWNGNMTNAELEFIRNNPSILSKTVFFKTINGVVTKVGSPF